MRRFAPPSHRHAPRFAVPPLLAILPLLTFLLVLAGCAGSPPRSYPPLRYGYLTPLPLNVASISVESHFVPAGPDDLNGLDPAPLVPTLEAMAQDRLHAVGSAGRAVFVIKDASLERTGDGIQGTMDVELDVYGGGGTRAAFAEARVSRVRTGDIGDMPSALYDLTSQLMDAMNIEFEYQVRRSLKDWLVAPGASQAPVQQQVLPPPPGVTQAPSATPLAAPGTPPTPLAAPGAAPTTLAPPAYPQSPYATPSYPPASYPQPAYPQPAYPQPSYPAPAYPQQSYPPPSSSLPPPTPYPAANPPPSSSSYPALHPGQSLGTLPTQLVPPGQP